MNNVCLRDATIKDELLVFEWRNIENLVALSSKQKKVTFEEHKEWFKKKIKNSNCRILIIQLKNKNIGLIRLELENKKNCKISIYLIPGYEGQGFGSAALSQVINSDTIKCNSYLADVQISNISSQKFFQKLGFSKSLKNSSSILFKKKNIFA
jgi:RimJ/RimL family protein N-acetyltransferase